MIIILILTLIFETVLLEGINQAIIETGKAQYQVLKDRGNLPQYGICWKQAVENLERGCTYLTEDTQSELALQFTNCFLKVSGHETYNCDMDKKRNLRAICISNMPDRAFNVYTEFYTHIQNICGFLQGHVWHEIISENTLAVGMKLKETAKNQEGLLKAQEESLKLQEKMLQHGRVLENVLEDLYLSFKSHQDILNLLSKTINNLQSWLVGEMSWFESIMFHTVAVILAFLFTSSRKTHSARIFILLLLLMNYLLERFICIIYTYFYTDSSTMYQSLYNYIWCIRYAFMISTMLVIIYFIFCEYDPLRKHYDILCTIYKQNVKILNSLDKYNRPAVDCNKLNNVKDDKDMSNKFLKNLSLSLDNSHMNEIELNNSKNKYNKSVTENYNYNLRSGRSRSKCKSIETADNLK